MGRPSEEHALVERARRGDSAAFEQLVRMHQQVAFRTACLLAGSAADAEEAVQDGFVKAWQALARFRSGSPFRPWLLAIVANEARTRRRAAGRRDGWTLRAIDAARSEPAAAAGPEAAVLATEQRATLLAALAQLTERDRTVLALRYLLDLGEADIAAALGCRRGTVKSRLSRALDRLREVVT